MALSVRIDAEAKIFRLFDLHQLMEGAELDLQTFDLFGRDDVDRLYRRVSEFVETGEIGAYDDIVLHVHGINPEVCEITLKNPPGEEKTVTTDDITLQNRPFAPLLEKLTHYPPGRLFLATVSVGDGAWDFDSDIEEGVADPARLLLGYYDCGEEMDPYALLASALFEPLCDLLSTDEISYAQERLEMADFVFHPRRVYGQLFVVTQLNDTDTRVLTRIDPPSVELQDMGWPLMQNLSDEV